MMSLQHYEGLIALFIGTVLGITSTILFYFSSEEFMSISVIAAAIKLSLLSFGIFVSDVYDINNKCFKKKA
jgi:hypothetical protein